MLDGMSTVLQERRRPVDTLPLRLLAIRHELGLSQREASARCGVPYGVWQGMESGRSTRDRDMWLTKVAAATGYEREWLVWGGTLVEPTTPDGGGNVVTLRPDRPGQNRKLLHAA